MYTCTCIFQARERRQQEIENNPYYLPSKSQKPSKSKSDDTEEGEEGIEIGKSVVKDIPVSKLEIGIPLLLGELIHVHVLI